MDPLATRAMILRAWPAIASPRITPPELQTVHALLDGVSAGPLRHALHALYAEPLTAKALHWGDVIAVVDALKWRQWIPTPVPDVLWQRKRETAKHLREPVWVPVVYDEHEDEPEQVLTVDGVMRFEEGYLPRVCCGEQQDAAPEAKAALVIAARTFVLRAMRDHPTLGRTTPIQNGDNFQVFAPGATAGCMEAARRTRGIVMQYGGRLIVANYVAGAPWSADGSRGKDSTGTEKWVTYNDGRKGADVIPTRLTLKTHPGNRGCMSQNGAQWLAAHGLDCFAILRFFYGEDVEFVQLGAGRRGSVLFGLAALGVLGLAATGGG